MKLKLAGLMLLLLAASAYAGTMYEVNVSRIEQDLYKVTGRSIFIKTLHCYQYAYSQDAVLVYDRYSYDNHLVFDDGETCKVKAVFE